jgi:hypothetical protein
MLYKQSYENVLHKLRENNMRITKQDQQIEDLKMEITQLKGECAYGVDKNKNKNDKNVKNENDQQKLTVGNIIINLIYRISTR